MKTNNMLKGLGVVGAAVAAWFLFEPKKGSQRRERIASLGRDVYEGAEQEVGRLGGEISRLSGDVSRGFSSIVERVTEMAGISTSGGSTGTATPTAEDTRSTRGARRRTRSSANGDAG